MKKEVEELKDLLDDETFYLQASAQVGKEETTYEWSFFSLNLDSITAKTFLDLKIKIVFRSKNRGLME